MCFRKLYCPEFWCPEFWGPEFWVSRVLVSRVLVYRVLESRVLVSRVLVTGVLVSRELVSRVLVPRILDSTTLDSRTQTGVLRHGRLFTSWTHPGMVTLCFGCPEFWRPEFWWSFGEEAVERSSWRCLESGFLKAAAQQCFRMRPRPNARGPLMPARTTLSGCQDRATWQCSMFYVL